MENSIAENNIAEKCIAEKSIIKGLTQAELVILQTSFPERIIVIKFSADWCVPCKKIKPIWKKWLETVPSNIICIEVDIDNSLDLYMSFKNKKIINGIPAILAFYGDTNKRESWFLPDDIFAPKKVIEEEAEEFLGRCSQKAITIM
jgi:thiol-disulfide isomerase/thioredoxin